jgi:hypothetical protein
VLVKLMAVRPADIDEGALRRNAGGAVIVRPYDVEDDDGRSVRVFGVSADFCPVGAEHRTFRTLEGAMGLVVALVLAAEETARRPPIRRPTIEIQVEI